MMRAGLVVRSLAFWTVFALSILVFTPLVLLTAPLPFAARYGFIQQWVRLNIWWLEKTCKLTYRVEGTENLPANNAIAMVKHQSTWETLALQRILPPQAWIAKRELLWVPFFGWSLAMLEPIWLNRQSPKKALNQLITLGTKRLQQGRWVIIFPEGTRIAPGKKGKYQPGGAFLAAKSGFPVVPIAHNAGTFWPRRGFIKYPGRIEVRIGPVIETRGKKTREITQQVEAWIEAAMVEIEAASKVS